MQEFQLLQFAIIHMDGRLIVCLSPLQISVSYAFFSTPVSIYKNKTKKKMQRPDNSKSPSFIYSPSEEWTLIYELTVSDQEEFFDLVHFFVIDRNVCDSIHLSGYLSSIFHFFFPLISSRLTTVVLWFWSVSCYRVIP